jgi:ketosteroid isomerase-like protein
MIHFFKFASRRRIIILTFFSILCAFSLTAWAASKNGGIPRGQRHEYRREIEQLEDTWRDAVLRGNAATMDSLLAADYIAITANGTLQSREETLANLRSGTIHITVLDVSDRKVRFYGKTALVTCKTELSGTSAEENISGNYRYTRVYVRDVQGKWKIVSFEASLIRESGERK